MSISNPSALIPGLPPSLEEFVRAFYTDEHLARRAILAPWAPSFRSAWDDRHLWEGYPTKLSEQERRTEYEQIIVSHDGSLAYNEGSYFVSTSQPFFVSEGTLGTLRSPFPQLSDKEYWAFVMLWEGEMAARRNLERQIWDNGKTSIAFLAAEQSKGTLQKIFDRWSKKEEPLVWVWRAHFRLFTGIYS
jgi:hypothetical protein